MELQEAAQIHQGLLHGRQNSLQDMKAIVKTWRNRLPIISDNLSHWNEIFTWRQQHYQFIANHYNQESDQASNHSMLGVHASAQAIIHFGKIARKQNLTGVCRDSLSKIYTIPSVPIVDCFQKIRQQVKCYVQMAVSAGKNELQEGLEVIESTNLKYLAREMTAEFYALKGMLLAQIGRSEDANKAFSAAVQMHDTLVKAWALWGDYLEHLFTRETGGRNMKFGVEAITCYLHACKPEREQEPEVPGQGAVAADVRYGAAGAGGGRGQVHDGGAAHPVAALDPAAAHLPRQERGQAHTQPPLTGRMEFLARN